jgi:very-short-patch-repair endonuclease
MATAHISFGRRHAIYLGKLRRNPTPAEHQFCRYLDALGLGYRFQQGFYHPFVRIADFFLPDHNLIVEIDGAYHDIHKDRERDRLFETARGIRTVRLTNEQVLSGDFENLYVILYDRTGKRAIQSF